MFNKQLLLINYFIIQCKYCNSGHIKGNGHKCNKQRYYCNDCHRSFCEKDNRIKRDIRQRELCLLYYIVIMYP